jgi:phosphate-selective porin OprO/OprP
MGTFLKRGLAATFAATLMCGVSTAALAAPAKDAAKLDAMQQQLDEMRAQLQALQGANANDARLSAIQAQLDAMAKQLAEVKGVQETANADIATLRAPPTGGAVATTLSNGKPAFATADGRFTANIRAIVMADAGRYFQKDNLGAAVVARDLNEGVNFRRARIGFDGRLFKDFDYAFVYEFGGSGVEEAGRLYEASMTYTALKPLRIKFGAFEPNVGLAAATSTSAMPLLERPAPAEAARNVAAGDSRAALQVIGNGMFGGGDTGVGVRWLASGALTGNTLGGTQQFDEQTAVLGRIALAPFASTDWQAHLGANFQRVISPNDATGGAAGVRYPIQIRDRPELRLDGTRIVDAGAIDSTNASVFGLEAAGQFGPILIEAETFKFEIERRASTLANPKFDGFYVQGSWVLTGEPRLYDPLEGRFAAPRQNVNFAPSEGAWGAFEVAARYSVLDLNFREGTGGPTPAGGVRGGEQKIMSVGFNWYLNPAIRTMIDYQHVEIDRLSATGVQVGQEYDAVAARAQFTF